jgi:hypothetical protein
MMGQPLLGGVLIVILALFALAVISRIVSHPAPAGAVPVAINWVAIRFGFFFFVAGWMAIDLLGPYRLIRWAIPAFCAGLACYWLEVYGFNQWRQAVPAAADRIRQAWQPIRAGFLRVWEFILSWPALRDLVNQHIVAVLGGLVWVCGLFYVSRHGGIPDPPWKASQYLVFLYWVAPGVPAAISTVWNSTRQWTLVFATAFGLFTLWWLAASLLGLACLGLVASVTLVWLSRYFPAR